MLNIHPLVCAYKNITATPAYQYADTTERALMALHAFKEASLSKVTELRDMINSAEGRSYERCVEALDIVHTCVHLPHDYRNASLKTLEGCSFDIDLNAQSFPKSYRYTPISTHFFLTVEKGKWNLTDVRRMRCTTIKIRTLHMTTALETHLVASYRNL